MQRDPTVVRGPVSKLELRQSLLLSDDKFSIYFTRSIAGPITVIAIVLTLFPLYKLLWRKARHWAPSMLKSRCNAPCVPNRQNGLVQGHYTHHTPSVDLYRQRADQEPLVPLRAPQQHFQTTLARLRALPLQKKFGSFQPF